MPTVWKNTKRATLSIRLDQAWPNHIHFNAAEDGAPHDVRSFAIGGADERGFYRCNGIKAQHAAELGMPLDDNGCIALHPGDPAMRKIAELEARVKELDEKHEEALRREKAANEALHLERCKVDGMAERYAEIERGSQTPTVAPELTDKRCLELWSVYASHGSTIDGTRAMLAAYEKMRRPLTDDDVERAAEAAAHASTFTWTSWDVASDVVKNDYRRIARAALETVR